MQSIALSVLKIAATAYVGLCVLVVLIQSSYVYFPQKGSGPTPRQAGMAFDEIRLETADGEKLLAWFVPAPKQSADALTVLFCHGNAGNIHNRLVSIRSFYDRGMNVLVFDYRGYGESTGRPSEKGTYADVQAAWDYLRNAKGIPADRILVFGRSLGGGIASWLAAKEAPAGLLLESTFTSAGAMAARMFPYLPTRLLCRFKYDTLARIGQMKCPVIIAHSREDTSIPFSHAEELFRAAAEPKLFLETRGDHNDGGLDNHPEHIEALLAFVGHDS